MAIEIRVEGSEVCPRVVCDVCSEAPEDRIAQLVREGTSGKWARAEVLGADWPLSKW